MAERKKIKRIMEMLASKNQDNKCECSAVNHTELMRIYLTV